MSSKIIQLSFVTLIQMRFLNTVIAEKTVPQIICLPEMFQTINFREPENQSRFKTRPLKLFLLDLL